MAAFRAFRERFETELRERLEIKSSLSTSAEVILIRAFKYFDLNNSGCVDVNEFYKAIEKIGVTMPDRDAVNNLFYEYDKDKSGALDYKEFSSGVFGSGPVRKAGTGNVGQAMRNLKESLAGRGARGIIGLGRQFRIMDDNNSRTLDFREFAKAMRDYRVGLDDLDLRLVFNQIDRDRSGEISYDEFLRAIRGEMNEFRKNLVARAFQKLDSDRSGAIEVVDLRQFYDATNHPDVKANRKSEDEILEEFLDTFEMYHSVNGRHDRVVTPEEFIEYYNNVSMSIDNDQYFELMIVNAWKLNKSSANIQQSWSNMEEEIETPQLRKSAQRRKAPVETDAPVQGNRGKPARGPQRAFDAVLDRFRQKLAQRGARGLSGLARQFKIADDNNSQSLDLYELTKCCKDYRIEVTDSEMKALFNAFDRDGSGEIDYNELLRGIRGSMNPYRRNLVRQAFSKLDLDNSGVVDIEEIKQVYDASRHPDVIQRRKTEEEVLCDFLETFELHHNISDKSQQDQKVTYEEFEEYYNNVSASIDDNAYFETMMANAWKLTNTGPVRKAWAGEFSRQTRLTESRQAPFGTQDTPTNYATNLRPTPSRREVTKVSSGMSPAGKQTSVGLGEDYPPAALETLINVFRTKIMQRGARGIIGLARQFSIMDDNDNKVLEFGEFSKAVSDYRMEIPPGEMRRLFTAFDTDGSGAIDYNEFLRAVRGQMSTSRKNLVVQAFKKLDRTGDGIVDITDIKGQYNAGNHPDVKSCKKTEDEVLGDFLSTFETHHSIAKGGAGRDQRVTLEEFVEYYTNVSASIDDDRYFELMMRNSWNFGNVSYAKGWSSDATEAPKRRRIF